MDYAIAPEALAAIRKSVSLGHGSLRTEAPMALSDWAAQHFKLAGESFHQKGGWIAWSLQIGILDFMSEDPIEEIEVLKLKRVGSTKMITAFIAYTLRRIYQIIGSTKTSAGDCCVPSANAAA